MEGLPKSTNKRETMGSPLFQANTYLGESECVSAYHPKTWHFQPLDFTAPMALRLFVRNYRTIDYRNLEVSNWFW